MPEGKKDSHQARQRPPNSMSSPALPPSTPIPPDLMEKVSTRARNFLMREKMLTYRNQTSHTYNQDVADEIAVKVTELYCKLFLELEKNLLKIKDREDDQSMRFGLNDSVIARINTVFSGWPEVEEVILYGSRAKGSYRVGSDIDLTIIGDTVTQSQMLKIAQELDDLLLPYKIDLSLLRQIKDKPVLEHIKRAGVAFYKRSMNL